MTTAPMVVLKDIAKRWNGQLGVEGISLDIPEGSFTALLGPSGCGKSTTLRLLAGLELPDEGTILIDGKDVTTSAASDRNLSMVFQSYALFPHLSVAENVVFGLKVRRVPKQERQEKLHRALEITGLLGYENRKPGELSGGQRQRVSIAKAMAGNPPVLLMDESLAQLDLRTKSAILLDMKAMIKRSQSAALLVLHDPADALLVADTLWVIRGGKLVQSGTPNAIIAHPAHYEIAGLFDYINVVPADLNIPGPWREENGVKWLYAHDLPALDAEVLDRMETPSGSIIVYQYQNHRLLKK